MSWSEIKSTNETYQVSTEVYEGPLDLLLDLIERAELDITVLSLAQVTDQFLAYLSRIEYCNASEVSSFLVIAAKLIQIKSLALLPHAQSEVVHEGEEDPGEALTRQLIEYKKFKEVANFLSERASQNLHTYLRMAPSPKIQGKVDMEGITLKDLIQAAQDVFAKNRQMEPLGTIVSIPRVTIHERIKYITAKLYQQDKVNFSALISDNQSRINIVVTFLALLELIRRQFVSAYQDLLFGEILLIPSTSFDSQDFVIDDFTDQ